MLIRRTAPLMLAVIAATAIAWSPARGQLVAECVRGDPRLPQSADPEARARLEQLAWRHSYEAYLSVLVATGPAAVLDTIVQHTRDLLAVAGPLPAAVATDTALLVRRLGDIRAMLPAAPGTAAIAVERIPPFGHLRAAPDLMDPDVAIFTGGEPARVTLRFDPANPTPAIAICAAYQAAHAFLDYLQAPALRETAERYARLSRRWDEYIERGYSLTFVERLGHSCRLGPINWIVATATARQCGSDALPPLGPPRMRTIFAHPTAGLAPLLTDSSAFTSGAIVEWYGILVHRFPDDDALQTFGISFATAYPATGPRRLGAVVHLSEIPILGIPLPKVGIFEDRAPGSSWRGRIFVTADVVGWVPGVRSAAREIAVRPLVRHLAGLARARLGP